MTEDSTEETPPRFWSLQRTTLTCLGAFLLWIAVSFASTAHSASKRNQTAETAEPLRMTVDLSQTGSYTGALQQVASHTCKQLLFLKAPAMPRREDDLAEMAKGLKGHLVIGEPGARPVFERPFDNESLIATLATATNVLWDLGVRFSPLRQNNYIVTLTVESPAKAMSGKEQFLVGRYELCGIERLGAAIPAGVAFTVLLLSFLCFLPAIRFLFAGARRNPTA